MEIRSCSICLFYFTESERTYSAAIPLPMVKYLLGQYLVFLSSTVNGYEGTGRSLSLKLVQKLQEQSHIYAKSTEGTGQQNNCESKTTNLRSQIRRKGNGPEDINQASDVRNPWPQSDLTKSPSRHETQLKASRDVAMATAAKAKLLLRELKTVKADLAFAKARCAQLEEENKLLREREGSDKGLNRDDDDLIRHQLETLLGEKARLANENETYSRENRFLREIVEYHQLTMQDVVYLDEGMEEVTELYPMDANGVARLLSGSPHSSSPTSPDEVILGSAKAMFPVPEEEDDDKSTSEENETPSPPSVSVSKHAK